MKDSYRFKLRLILSIFWIVMGIILIMLCETGRIKNGSWTAIGGGFIGAGIMQLIRKIRYMKDPEYKEKVDIGEKDERNSFVRLKAWSWAGYVFVLGAAFLYLVFMIAGHQTVSQVLGLCICAQLVIYWIAYCILKRKY